MNPIVSKEEKELIGRSDRPAVSIILPFEPKMSVGSELEYKLKLAMGKVEKELLSNYPADMALPVITKLQQLIGQLNFNTHKKSIALFASPSIDKVFYLDVAVEEKIVIDESFEIRDLVYSKKQTIQYLVMLLSGKSSKMFLGNCSKFLLIKSNVPDSVFAYERDMPEKVTHYSDAHQYKEILLEKFLHHMDEGLSLILKAYPLPVFVMGAKRVLGHFNQISKNQKSILQYIHGNYEECTEFEIRQIIRPYVADWNKVRQQSLLQQIGRAKSDNILSSGMEEVWAAASHKNGHLLIVEKDFMFPAHRGHHEDRIYKEETSHLKPFYIKDAVDDVMEKVLQIGGDVEFVDNGVLKDYGQIALIRYF
jgi:hypothetical protein